MRTVKPPGPNRTVFVPVAVPAGIMGVCSNVSSVFQPTRTQVLSPGGMTADMTVGRGEGTGNYIVYAASWDGSLHKLNAADGEILAPPVRFMPFNGKPYALNLVNNVIYTHSAQGFGGNPNMAYDLSTNTVGSWGPAGGGTSGRSGPAVSKDLVMYTGTGDGPWDPENGLYGNGIIGVKQNAKTKALELVD